jgi:hypothetical protein
MRGRFLTPSAGNERAPVVTLLLVMLLVNALPAFVVLSIAAAHTDHWFVWTIHPAANARVLAAMYGNAFLLALLAWRARAWPRMRSAMVVVVPFSIAATIVTLVTLDPFLEHPHYELVYWLVNYSTLFVAAPLAFVANEHRAGGRLPRTDPLASAPRLAFVLAGTALVFFGVTLLFELSWTMRIWPFPITPLVSRILGVWFCSLGAAYLWSAWDGDRDRARPIVLQAPLTAVLLAIVPLIHHEDVRSDAAAALAAYLGLAVLVGLVAAGAGRRPGPGR